MIDTALVTQPKRNLASLFEDAFLTNDLFARDIADNFQPFRSKNPAFPPYNIIKEDDGVYLIELAIAGLSKKDVEVVLDNDRLTVKSVNKEETEEEAPPYVHRGIAKRSFSSSFRLPEHSEVVSCNMQNGILTIKVARNIPEEKLPKVIKIT